MKNISSVFSILAFVGVVILFVMKFSGDNSGSGKSAAGASPIAATGRIAFVNIDTLEANYEYLKTKKAEFEKRQEGMKAELMRSQQQMQSDINSVQRKAQAGTLTQAEYESAQKRLGQMDQSLKSREAALTEQLMSEQDVFNKDLQSRLDSFLAEYNKDKKYDYILSYTRSGQIMYANPALDITADVIKGMNAKMGEEKKK